jgi:formylmethanofuran dehydrogenase subunit E
MHVTVLLVAIALTGTPDEDLAAVAAVHGEAGPWAVAGWRMAKYAMAKLGPELEVKHESPRAVQFSCIADGAQAATKTSVGKLSLSWVESTQTRTTFTNREGKSLTLQPSEAFVKRFKDTPREKAKENGRIVLGLKDDEIFTVAK